LADEKTEHTVAENAQSQDVYREEVFTKEEDEEGEQRPELAIPLKERRLITQPFDFIVNSLETQIKDKSLLLQDEFQRRRVWDDAKSSRLIESLLLNVPIPVCYFAELDDGTYSVIDGQQRLTSIFRYMTNQFSLRGLRIRPELNRKRFHELDGGDQRLIKTRSIRCIVIQKESHPEIRFDVFERLNSGAVRLNPQELRNSAYRGALNKLIRKLCENKEFQETRNATSLDKRMGDAELILRFMAFHYSPSKYRGYYAPFLDEYLRAGVRMDDKEIAEHERFFLETIEKVKAVFGNMAFRRFDKEGKPENQINRAVFDVIMLTFARVDRPTLEAKKSDIVAGLRDLSQNDPEFVDAISQATRDKRRINARLSRWIAKLRSMGVSCPDIVFGD
jgi:hypothetical protein